MTNVIDFPIRDRIPDNDLHYRFAEQCGAEFDKCGFSVSFRSRAELAAFCEMLTNFDWEEEDE